MVFVREAELGLDAARILEPDSVLAPAVVGVVVIGGLRGGVVLNGNVVAQSALDAVPKKYYEGALALGADHERAVFRVIVPAAVSGIMAGIVLGVGRAIGETMAVIMVAGNQPAVPGSIFDGVRTMTANIVMEMGYATDLHREALIATAVVLFVFILIINVTFSLLRRKDRA